MWRPALCGGDFDTRARHVRILQKAPHNLKRGLQSDPCSIGLHCVCGPISYLFADPTLPFCHSLRSLVRSLTLGPTLSGAQSSNLAFSDPIRHAHPGRLFMLMLVCTWAASNDVNLFDARAW